MNSHCQLMRLTRDVTAVSNTGGRASKYTVLGKEAGSWEKGQVLGLGSRGKESWRE